MNSFKLFRTICRSTGIFKNSYFNFMYCRLDDICKNWSGITYNRLFIIVIKNHCPFCGKSLRVVPINSEEYCPHCGCKIEQEHKKIQIWWWGAFHEKEYIKDYRCDNVNYSYCIYNVCIEPSRKEFPLEQYNYLVTVWCIFSCDSSAAYCSEDEKVRNFKLIFHIF